MDKYNTALKEQMTTAVRVEPGVLTYYAVADKNDPSQITILEIYADTVAYQSHITTTHFKKYKEAVKNMVKSLELVDVPVRNSEDLTHLAVLLKNQTIESLELRITCPYGLADSVRIDKATQEFIKVYIMYQ